MKRMMIAITACLVSLLSVLAGARCSKAIKNAPFRITSIDVSKTSLDLKVGESEQLKAAAVPAVVNQPQFQWVSQNNSVVTVSNGLVHAVNAGETTIEVAFKDIRKVVTVKVTAAETARKPALLYKKLLTNNSATPDLILNGAGHYTTGGLQVTGKNDVVKLNKFYAVAERMIQYRIVFSGDARALFRSSEGDFNAFVDIANKTISIATNPVTEKRVAFLRADRQYLVEMYHIYQEAKVRIVDVQSGETDEISAIHDGQGGVGKGVLQPGFAVGMQWDHYCFGLMNGTFMLVKEIVVSALKNKVKLLMYGDSITQPEGYFPTRDFPMSWTQQVIHNMQGNAMSSGRGGATIDMLLDYIKNELPFIETRYVMVTIGTNGGNTKEKLTRLVEYIRSQGAIPVLNNIPCNESGTQVAENLLIGQVRREEGLKGCRFDAATSLAGDGKTVDKSLMYWEDYTGSYGWQIYHHPNEKGGKKMFDQTRIDVPEIY